MADKFETIQRKFLWGYFSSDFDYHLLRWIIVKLPMLDEGLDVENLGIFNEALLGKWLWRFMNEKVNLWRRWFALNMVRRALVRVLLDPFVLMS